MQIALAILGLIATFTLPKVISNIDQAQNEAKFKDAIALIEQISAEAFMEGKYNDNRWDYFVERVNAVKICATNGVTEGCNAIITGQFTHPNNALEKALVLPNGVVIGGFRDDNNWDKLFSGEDGWHIDVNGIMGPNENGIDVLILTAPRFTANGGMNSQCTNSKLVCPYGSVSTALYNSLFD